MSFNESTKIYLARVKGKFPLNPEEASGKFVGPVCPSKVTQLPSTSSNSTGEGEEFYSPKKKRRKILSETQGTHLECDIETKETESKLQLEERKFTFEDSKLIAGPIVGCWWQSGALPINSNIEQQNENLEEQSRDARESEEQPQGEQKEETVSFSLFFLSLLKCLMRYRIASIYEIIYS